MPVIANGGQATLNEGGSSCPASGLLEPTIAADRLREPLNRVVRWRSAQQVVRFTLELHPRVTAVTDSGRSPCKRTPP